MIEVFKTDVSSEQVADLLLNEIHNRFPLYEANFDLQDCDNILRIETILPNIPAASVIDLLSTMGFTAEVLPETPSYIPERIGNSKLP